MKIIRAKTLPARDEVVRSGYRNGYPVEVPRWYTRIFEILPGLIIWFFILLPVIGALLHIYLVVVVYIAFLVVFWGYRALRFLQGLIIGYFRYKRDMATDFMAKLRDEDLHDLKFVLIFPMVKEGMETVEPSIEAWSKQDIGADKISVVFALEEPFTDDSLPTVRKLYEKYHTRFREMITIIHPHGVEGEAVGVKGANINWATRKFVDIVNQRGEDLSDYLLITNDNDLRPHEKYLSAIAVRYFETPPEVRLRRFYCTAVHTFNNNIWRVPPIVRIFSLTLTLAIFHSWVVMREFRDTWSAYVVNLQTVRDIGFWDPEVGVDDTYFYWAAKLHFHGDFAGEEVYIPTYNDAVENKTRLLTYKSLYKQQLRWGWGIVVFPITFAGMYSSFKKISHASKIGMAAVLFYNQVIFLTVVFSITFALPILQWLSPEYRYSAESYNLVQLMRIIMTGLMFFNIPIYIIRKKISPPPGGWAWWRHVWDIVEIVLITVNMLTFGFIPKVHAFTEMALNKKRKRFYATDKVAIK